MQFAQNRWPLCTSMNSPLPSASVWPLASIIRASLQCLRPSLRTRRPSTRMGAFRVYGTKVVDLHLAGHGRQPRARMGLAHRLVQQRGDDAAMQVTGRALEAVRNRRQANHAPVLGNQNSRCKPPALPVRSQSSGSAPYAPSGSVFLKVSS